MPCDYKQYPPNWKATSLTENTDVTIGLTNTNYFNNATSDKF
ncbi:hypothetical protein [Mucilaginibacter mali]|nr:hypothetical protein [Mucilaginibacter mali]